MALKKFSLFLLYLSCCLTVIGQSKKNKLSEIMRTYHDYNMFDGAVLVAEKGQVVYKAALGPANREWNIPNSIDTKFMVG